MRHYKKVFKTLFTGACVMLCVPVFAQTDDISVFDNSGDDFLLPSYFDTPASTFVPPEAPPAPNPPPASASVQMANTTQIPSDIDILTEIFGSKKPLPEATSSVPAQKKATTQVFRPMKNIQSEKAPLLTPLDPIPPAPEPILALPKKSQIKSTYATKLLAKETGKAKGNVQLPKDMRLMFEPNSARLAESVVKWLTAYSLHTQKDPSLVLNIRISNQDWSLQQARLGLVIKLLIEKGLSAKQIQVFQSDREPDTMIISAETNPNQTRIVVPAETKRVIREQKTLTW